MKRVFNFRPPPLVERTQLPPEKQPHRTLYGKLACYMRGIDPYPPPTAPSQINVEIQEENKVKKEKSPKKEESEMQIISQEIVVDPKNEEKKIYPINIEEPKISEMPNIENKKE